MGNDADNPDDDLANEAESKSTSRARATALRALGRRELSSRELQNKLKSQGFDAACIENVAEDMASTGWQSDQRYAEMLVRSRSSHGYGPRRISAELAARGVEAEIIKEVLAAAECDWSELAQQIYRRRFSAAAKTPSERQKRYRFLAGRGFDGEQIRAAMQLPATDDAE